MNEIFRAILALKRKKQDGINLNPEGLIKRYSTENDSAIESFNSLLARINCPLKPFN